MNWLETRWNDPHGDIWIWEGTNKKPGSARARPRPISWPRQFISHARRPIDPHSIASRLFHWEWLTNYRSDGSRLREHPRDFEASSATCSQWIPWHFHPSTLSEKFHNVKVVWVVALWIPLVVVYWDPRLVRGILQHERGSFGKFWTKWFFLFVGVFLMSGFGDHSIWEPKKPNRPLRFDHDLSFSF